MGSIHLICPAMDETIVVQGAIFGDNLTIVLTGDQQDVVIPILHGAVAWTGKEGWGEAFLTITRWMKERIRGQKYGPLSSGEFLTESCKYFVWMFWETKPGTDKRKFLEGIAKYMGEELTDSNYVEWIQDVDRAISNIQKNPDSPPDARWAHLWDAIITPAVITGYFDNDVDDDAK